MIHLIQSINDFSLPWATAMLRAVWQGAIALSIAWMICLALPRIPARMRCWIWRAAYFKLLLGLIWATPINLALLPAKPTAAAPETTPVHLATEAKPLTGDISESAVITSQTPIAHPIEKPRMTAPPAIAKFPRLSVSAILLLLWLAGVAVGCVQLANEWQTARRLRRGARPICDTQLMDRLARLAARMGLRRPPKILGSSDVPGPLFTGQFRPVVILPVSLLQTCESAKIEIAAAHELAHLRRRDLHWCWLPRISRILFFFHPLVLLTQRDWRAAQESACDEAAVAATGIGPSEYGEALLQIISMSSFPRRPVLALGIADSRKSLERRLLAMKHFTSASRHPRILGFALGCAIVVGLVPFHVTAQTPAPSSTGEVPPAVASQPHETATARAGDAPIEATNEELASADPSMAWLLKETKRLKMEIDDRLTKFPKDDPSLRAMQESLSSREREIEQKRQAALKSYVWVSNPDTTEKYLLRRALPTSGTVVGVRVKLSSAVVGVIREVHCKNGQQVKKGDILLQLDNTEAVALLEIAKSNLDQAEVEHSRQQRMYKQNIAGVSDVESAANAIQKDQSLLKIAEHQLSQTRITAPIDGMIIKSSAIAGQTVQAGEELAVVLNSDVLVFRGEIPVNSAALLKVGQKVIAGFRSEGMITFISPEISPVNNVPKVRIEATIDNQDGLLRDGSLVGLKSMPAE